MLTTLLRLAFVLTMVFSLTTSANAQGLLGSNPTQSHLKSTDAPSAPANQEVARVAKRTVADPAKIQFDEIQSNTSASPGSFQPSKIPSNLTLVPNLPPSVKPPVTRQDMENRTTGFRLPTISNQAATPSISGARTTPGTSQLYTVGWSKQPTYSTDGAGISTPVAVTSNIPQITTRVVAPRYVNLEQIAPVRIQLRNSSIADATSVKLVAILPTHAKFRAAQPQPTNVDGRKYEFVLDQIDRNQTREIQIDVVPTEKKPLTIETQLWLSNQQNVEVGVRQPKLEITAAGPATSHTGKSMTHTIVVQNTGDGIAEDIKLDCLLPDNVELVEGQKEYFLRQLTPGKSAKLQFRTAAYQPGDTKLHFQVASKGLKPNRTTTAIRVYQPQLIVSATGPKVNFVKRDGIYSINVENSGQVDVTNVEVAVRVPAGMQVTTVSRQAKIDKDSGIMIWTFDRLAAGAQQAIQLKAVSGAAGQQICRIAASSKETRAEKFDLVTDVLTRADVKFSVNCLSGPVEVGSVSKFAIIVENKGSSAATGVEAMVELPPSLMPIEDKAYSINELDNSIQFVALDLKPGEKKILQFKSSGVSKGEHVVRAILSMNETKRRLIAEDSVYVFETDHSKVTESLKPEIRR